HAGNAGRTRLRRAAAIEHRVIFLEQFRDRLVHADIDAAMERDAFAFQLRHAAVDMILLDLEVGNAVAHQSAGLAFTLIDVNLVASAAKLLGRSHSRRSGADDGYALAGLHGSRGRLHVTQLPSLIADGLFDALDRHGHIFKIERAGFLAGSRADAARPF